MDDHDVREGVPDAAVPPVSTTDAVAEPTRKKKKKKKKSLEDRKVYEAGAIIVADGKIALRLTDKQNWIFPKGKLKKRESPSDAAVREAVEETGLKVEVIDQVADLMMRQDGKKRRHVFFLMRAVGTTWDWPHHEGRDTFLMIPDRVAEVIDRDGYDKVWAMAEDRARALSDEATPSEAVGAAEA
jgi:8-oxo-dGTP pyrophosphatase MutT (NUDIX family)